MSEYGTLDTGPLVDTGGQTACFLGSACAGCGALAFPPRRRCANCAGTDLTPAPIAPYGRLYSYTVVRVGRKGELTPYALGAADFPDDVRVLAKIDGWAPDCPDSPIGRTVVAGVASSPSGDPRADYRLVVIEGGEPS